MIIVHLYDRMIHRNKKIYCYMHNQMSLTDSWAKAGRHKRIHIIYNVIYSKFKAGKFNIVVKMRILVNVWGQFNW